MIKQKRSKAQEEMVGFVLIIVLVTIIAVIFLGIFALKKPNIQSRQSELLESFIGSISYYTTDCQDEQNRYRTIGDLLGDCMDNAMCKDGRIVCQVVDKTLRGILNESYIVTNQSLTRYYNMSIARGENSDEKLLINEIIAGNSAKCNGPRFYSQKSFPAISRDKITIRFEVCNMRVG